MTEVEQKRKKLLPDLTVVTGGISDDVLGWYEGRSDAEKSDGEMLFVPGGGDRRVRFERAFGRRYRLDSTGYGRLDRVVTVGGLPLLLVDTADGAPEETQLLWIRSVTDELVGAANRGISLPMILLFSHRSLDASSLNDDTSRTIREITLQARRKGVALYTFSGDERCLFSEETGGVGGHPLSPFHIDKSGRLIEITGDGRVTTGII